VATVNIDQFVLGSRRKEILWNIRRRHPLAYWKNRLEWYLYPKIRRVPPFPVHVDFECSSLCNMNCPMCFRPHRADQNDGNMSFDLFQKGVDECARHRLYSIRVSWRGEPTVNPDLIEMIAYAKRAGIREVSFLTNGLNLTPEYSRNLVKSGVDYLSISIDGLYENYNRIRKPAVFEETLERIRELNRLRDSIGKGFPRIKINTIWTQIKDHAEEYHRIFEPLSDIISFNPDYDYSEPSCPVPETHNCQYLYQRLTVKWNGDVPMCISDWDGEVILGNIETDSLQSIWKGSRMNAVRSAHRKGRTLDYAPCRKCHRPVTDQVGNQRLS
jgi:radical SAM protein with 4Fe4S-binding SPASM domain